MCSVQAPAGSALNSSSHNFLLCVSGQLAVCLWASGKGTEEMFAKPSSRLARTHVHAHTHRGIEGIWWGRALLGGLGVAGAGGQRRSGRSIRIVESIGQSGRPWPGCWGTMVRQAEQRGGEVALAASRVAPAGDQALVILFCMLLLSGFGPFGEHTVNASWIAVQVRAMSHTRALLGLQELRLALLLCLYFCF